MSQSLEEETTKMRLSSLAIVVLGCLISIGVFGGQFSVFVFLPTSSVLPFFVLGLFSKTLKRREVLFFLGLLYVDAGIIFVQTIVFAMQEITFSVYDLVLPVRVVEIMKALYLPTVAASVYLTCLFSYLQGRKVMARFFSLQKTTGVK